MKVYVVLGYDDPDYDNHDGEIILTAFSDRALADSFIDEYKNYSKYSDVYTSYDNYKVSELNLGYMMEDGKRYIQGELKSQGDAIIKQQREEKEREEKRKDDVRNSVINSTSQFVYIALEEGNCSLRRGGMPPNCKWLIGPGCYGARLCRVDKEEFLQFEKTHLRCSKYELFTNEENARNYVSSKSS